MKNHQLRKCLRILAQAWLSVLFCVGAVYAEPPRSIEADKLPQDSPSTRSARAEKSGDMGGNAARAVPSAVARDAPGEAQVLRSSAVVSPEEKEAASEQARSVSEEDIETAPSLDLVTRYAVEHNPAIRAARFTWKAARERITQEKAYENPMITYSPDTGNTAETRAGPQGDGVGFSQAIPFPGKLTLRGGIADQEARAAYERLQAATQEISRQVRARYADYYLAARSLDINADTTELTRQFAAIAEAKYRVGTAAQQDVILSQEQLSRLAAERVVFEGDRETARGALNALLDRLPRAPIGAPQDLSAEELPVALGGLVEIADAARPELKEQDHFVEASRRSLRLARMGYLPDFSVGAQYVDIKGGSNPTFRRDGHDVWAVTLGFSVPIWIDRVQAEIHEMNARVMREKAHRRDLTNRVYDQVQRAYEQVRVAARTEKIYRTTLIPQTQERIGAARAGYETGRVDFLTLIDSLKSLEDVRLERDRSVRDYQRARADIERAIGRPIAGVAEQPGDGR